MNLRFWRYVDNFPLNTDGTSTEFPDSSIQKMDISQILYQYGEQIPSFYRSIIEMIKHGLYFTFESNTITQAKYKLDIK